MAELGVYPATTDTSADGLNCGENAGIICWAVAGTFCGSKVQGSFPEKHISCLVCDFFKEVKEEEKDDFLLLKPGQEDKLPEY